MRFSLCGTVVSWAWPLPIPPSNGRIKTPIKTPCGWKQWKNRLVRATACRFKSCLRHSSTRNKQHHRFSLTPSPLFIGLLGYRLAGSNRSTINFSPSSLNRSRIFPLAKMITTSSPLRANLARCSSFFTKDFFDLRAIVIKILVNF